MNQLIPFDQAKAIDLFKNPKDMQEVLDEIEKQAKDFEPDPTTAVGRKKIGSQAAMVSSSKVVIDKAKKVLTSDWAKKKKEVDALGKMAVDFCDRVRDEILDTRVQWQAKEDALAAIAAQKAEIEADEIEAHAENEIFDRERAIKVRETELARQEEERQRKEEEEKAQKERAAREERIRIEAKGKAKREAAEAVQREHERAEQAARDLIEVEDRAKRDAIEAAERAEREQAEAVERERSRAEAKAAEEKRQEATRAADRENRRKVNTKIVAAFKAEGIGEKTAQNIVRLVASGSIPHMTIRY